MVICASFGIARISHRLAAGRSWEAIWSDLGPYGDTPFAIYLALGIACLAAFRHLGHYARRRPFWQELGDVLAIVLTLAATHAALMFMTKANFSRLWWGISWTLVLLVVPLARFTLKRLLMARGVWWRPTVVIGAGPNAIEAASAFASEPLLGFEVIAFFCPPIANEHAESYREICGRKVPVLCASRHADLIPGHLGRPHIVVALEMEEIGRCDDFLERLNLHYGNIDIVLPISGLPLAGTHLIHFLGRNIVSFRVRDTLARSWPCSLKRAFDAVVAAALLVLCGPFMIAIALALRCDGGPALFRQNRVGQGGWPFVCYKFRTMVVNADQVLTRLLGHDPAARAEWVATQKLKNDPRITRFGRWLRRTSLDELPQLLNVIRGEMSLVGPRPIPTYEVPYYGPDILRYLQVAPGITGLWQVSGRNNLDYQTRIGLNSWYTRNNTFGSDIYILAKTACVVVSGKGAL